MDKIPFDPYDFFGYIASGLLFVIGMNLVVGFPKVLGQDLKIVDSAALILGVYVAGQILATPSKAVMEDWIVFRLLGTPSETLMVAKKAPLRRLLFPNFYRSLPAEAITRINVKTGHLKGESLFHHIRFSKDVCANEKLIAKLDTFRNKYGFARNLCFTSLVVGVALIVKSGFRPSLPIFQYGITALLASLFLFYRYLKFFRQYSYELFSVYGGKE